MYVSARLQVLLEFEEIMSATLITVDIREVC